LPAPNAVRRRDRQAAAVGRRAQQIEADIGAPGAPSLIAAKVLAELGTVDILAYNAATVEPAELPRPPGSVREF
jgi:NAD(P)-dependent dehydrogenase (short-subunit alcohol dehydrogenase family)